MTPTQQQAEWAERKQLARAFVRGAIAWAVRNGMDGDEARRQVAAEIDFKAGD
jgi:hypothetical protein